MTTQQTHIKQLNNSLDHIVEDLENLETPQDLDALDVSYEATLKGNITEITLTLTTGGPHIELNLCDQTINGYWGSDTRRRTINEHTNKKAVKGINKLWDYYKPLVKNTGAE